MRRVAWFVTGIAAGATGATYGARKVKHTAAQLKPANLARGAVGRAKSAGGNVVDALREGRSAMHDREDELRVRRDLRVETLDAQLEPGDQLLVDGRPVDTGRVIVLRARDQRRRRR